MYNFQQQKFLKRPTEDLESTGGVNNETAFGEPPIKLQCTQSSSASIGHVQQQSNNSTSNTGSGNNVGGAAAGTQPPPPNNPQGNSLKFISQNFFFQFELDKQKKSFFY